MSTPAPSARTARAPLLSGRPSMGYVLIGRVEPAGELSAAMLRGAAHAYDSQGYAAPLKLKGAPDDGPALGRVSRLQWRQAAEELVVWASELDAALQAAFLAGRYELANARFYWPKFGGGVGCRLLQASFQEAPRRLGTASRA
ncbi:hypothetical protein ACFPPF_06665 [Xenophilus aerolatus]|nr:hypothetical protein [Xenophilus aerolatus]